MFFLRSHQLLKRMSCLIDVTGTNTCAYCAQNHIKF